MKEIPSWLPITRHNVNPFSGLYYKHFSEYARELDRTR